MCDRYRNYEILSATEQPGVDFSIEVVDRSTSIVIAAPHGGGIEPGTSEIASAIAGTAYSLYLFNGLKTTGNSALHITSSNFDEPGCLALLRSAEVVVTIHGEESHTQVVFLGGCHVQGRAAIQRTLEEHGYSVKRHDDPNLQGIHSSNICNIGHSRSGVQLELSKGLRRSFFRSLNRAGRRQPTPELNRFAEVVRMGLRCLIGPSGVA
jgi:phage replication-related protein YjqB (UPF0714/DUF867 family)